MRSRVKQGYTLIEILVVVAIIGILASVVPFALGGARGGANDGRRKAEISEFGRLLTLGCFIPTEGPGDYDLAQIVPELRTQYPQYAQELANVPKDPNGGTDAETNYRYIVSSSGKCALYANFEKDAAATLTSISAPTPGGGIGTFTAPTVGSNGSKTYFQYSN